FNLSASGYLPLVLSLGLGTPAVSALGAVGAALTMSVRRGGLVLALIVLPLLTPAIIFGAGAVLLASEGSGFVPFLWLGAFALVATILAPFAAAAAARVNLAA